MTSSAVSNNFKGVLATVSAGNGKVALTFLNSKLESILKEIEEVQSVVTSKRIRHKIATYFLDQPHTSVLKNCAAELEWARIEFDVSFPRVRVPLSHARRNILGIIAPILVRPTIPTGLYPIPGFPTTR